MSADAFLGVVDPLLVLAFFFSLLSFCSFLSFLSLRLCPTLLSDASWSYPSEPGRGNIAEIGVNIVVCESRLADVVVWVLGVGVGWLDSGAAADGLALTLDLFAIGRGVAWVGGRVGSEVVCALGAKVDMGAKVVVGTGARSGAGAGADARGDGAIGRAAPPSIMAYKRASSSWTAEEVRAAA